MAALASTRSQVAPEVLRLFVRPKRLQYSTFVEFMQLLVAFSTGPEEFYEQARPSRLFPETSCAQRGPSPVAWRAVHHMGHGSPFERRPAQVKPLARL